MLDYFFFIFCFLSVFNLKIKGLDDFFFDYMKIENTSSIKGIFVWLIIFCHKSSYGVKSSYLFRKILFNLGQKVVSLFFFYSGFGIYENVKKKGVNYAKTLPNKAIILFLKFQIILLMYLITNVFILNKTITLKIYLLSFIFKLSLGNSNWFSFSIIMFYLYAFLSFGSLNNKNFIGIILISIICFFHTKLVFNYFYPKSYYAVDTVLCFVVGIYYSFMKINFDKVIMKNDSSYFFFASITIFMFYKSFNSISLITMSINNALFAIIIIFISMKIKFNNEFLKFLNFHSYSIYLLQRLVMLLVFHKHIFNNSDFIQISFEFTSIFCISALFDKYTFFIDNCLKKAKNKIINQNTYELII